MPGRMEAVGRGIPSLEQLTDQPDSPDRLLSESPQRERAEVLNWRDVFEWCRRFEAADPEVQQLELRLRDALKGKPPQTVRFLFDVNGTLSGSDGIPSQTIEAINLLAKTGIRVDLATGRGIADVRRSFNEADIDTAYCNFGLKKFSFSTGKVDVHDITNVYEVPIREFARRAAEEGLPGILTPDEMSRAKLKFDDQGPSSTVTIDKSLDRATRDKIRGYLESSQLQAPNGQSLPFKVLEYPGFFQIVPAKDDGSYWHKGSIVDRVVEVNSGLQTLIYGGDGYYEPNGDAGPDLFAADAMEQWVQRNPGKEALYIGVKQSLPYKGFLGVVSDPAKLGDALKLLGSDPELELQDSASEPFTESTQRKDAVAGLALRAVRQNIPPARLSFIERMLAEAERESENADLVEGAESSLDNMLRNSIFRARYQFYILAAEALIRTGTIHNEARKALAS